MADRTEVYLTLHPAGRGLVAHAASAASSGAGTAGRVLAANGEGRVDDSFLPFAGAADLADDEIEAAGLPAQTVAGGSRVWRWFGLPRLLAWLRVQAMNAVAPVGTVRLDVAGADDDYWLRLDGRTLGDGQSGADLSGDRYRDLYYCLWYAFTGSQALGVYSSEGLELARAAEAEIDWLSHHRLALPDPAGRTVLVAGAGAGLAVRAPGARGGSETVLVSKYYLPVHDHPMTVAQAGAAEQIQLVTGVTASASVTNVVAASPAVEAHIQLLEASAGEHKHTGTVTVSPTDLAPHAHGASAEEVEVGAHGHAAALDSDPLETVAVEDALGQTHGHAVEVQAGGGGSHQHPAGLALNLGGGGTLHTHQIIHDIRVEPNVTVASTPVITLNTTKVTRTISAVGEGGSRTGEAGQGSPLPVMPPFMAFVAVIRY
jgi:hypothetical protein